MPVQDIFGRVHSGERACKCTLHLFVKEFHGKSAWKSEFGVTKNLLLAASFSEAAGPPAGTVRDRAGVIGGGGGEARRRTCCELDRKPRHFTPATLILQWCASHRSSSLSFARNLKLTNSAAAKCAGLLMPVADSTPTQHRLNTTPPRRARM